MIRLSTVELNQHFSTNTSQNSVCSIEKETAFCNVEWESNTNYLMETVGENNCPFHPWSPGFGGRVSVCRSTTSFSFYKCIGGTPGEITTKKR